MSVLVAAAHDIMRTAAMANTRKSPEVLIIFDSIDDRLAFEAVVLRELSSVTRLETVCRDKSELQIAGIRFRVR